MDLTDFIDGKGDKLSVAARKQAHSKTGSFMPGRDEIGDDINWGDTGAIDHVLQGRTIGGASTTAIRDLTEQSRAANALKLPVEAGTRVSFQHNLGSVLAYANVPADKGTVVTVRAAGGDLTVHEGMVMVAWDDGQFLPVSPEHLRLASPEQKQAAKSVGKAKMKVTVFDNQGGGQATKGKTYEIIEFDGDQVVLRVPSRKKGVPEEFIVGKANVTISGGKKANAMRVSFIEFSSISTMFEQAKTGSSDLVHKATKDLWSFKQDDGNYVIERLFSEDGNPLKV